MKMKKQFIFSTIFVMVLAVTLPVMAQGGHRPPHPPHPVMLALDSDHNRVISADEIAASVSALMTLDKDGDGNLSEEEMRPQPPAGAPPMGESGTSNDGQKGEGRDYSQNQQPQGQQGSEDRPKPPVHPIVKVLDTDSDGILTSEEIARAPQALLTLDTDGDGQLSMEETRPKPPSFQ